MLRILVLCHGNICRSPLAAALFRAAIEADPQLNGRVEVSSAGTSDEHLGEGMHVESATLLRSRGLPTRHRARQLDRRLAEAQDLILAADRANLRAASRLLPPGSATELRLMRDFDPRAVGADLDDPWGLPSSAYERAAGEIEAMIPGLLTELRRRLASDSPGRT